MSYFEALLMEILAEANRERKIKQRMRGILTLGELIEDLEAVATKVGENVEVYFDFGEYSPGGLHSYRGYYEDLAIEPELCTKKRKTLGEFIEELKNAIGETFTGYKGGEYEMDENTLVWVSEWGESSGIAVVGVRTEGDKVIIETNYIRN